MTIPLGNDNYIAMQLTLDRMSRIVVPKAIRDRFALKPGDDLELTLEADGIRLRPVERDFNERHTSFHQPPGE